MTDFTASLEDNPQILGLPHTSWRPNQYAAYQTALALHRSGGGFLFTEQPTGSGKSGVATALGAHDNITVLVGTLNLLDQYHSQYGFSIIKGRANYECGDVQKIESWRMLYNSLPTAADCHYPDMHNCGFAQEGECAYLNAKEEALGAKRLAVTYPYAMLSRSIAKRKGILVCDEAHSLPDEIISFATLEVTRRTLERWSLPEFPFVSYGPDNKGDLLNAPTQSLLVGWLHQCSGVLAERIRSEGRQKSRAHSTLERFKSFASYLEAVPPEEIFVEITDRLLRIRPLSARLAAKTLFNGNKSTMVLMSATIGDPSAVASELDVDHYQWESYPHPIPIDRRPVFDLGCERMTFDNLQKVPSLYRIQAQSIRAWMRSFDPKWRGIILTSSYKKIQALAEVLVPAEPDRRFVVQRPGDSVSEVTDRFLRDHYSSTVLIASIQGFGHGLDLKGDLARFCVVAGVPHVNPWDRYEQLRKQRNAKFASWEVFCSIVQAAGRVSRGEIEPDGSYLLNYCALADGSATTPQARRFYPDWFNEAILPA